MEINDREVADVDLRRLRQLLHQRLIDSLEMGENEMFADSAALRGRIDGLIERLESDLGKPIEASRRLVLGEEVLQEVLGLGPLAPLMIDPGVSDILINGPHEVWVDRRGQLSRTALEFDNEGHLRRFLDRLVAAQGKHLDSNCPAVDARLPDGSRLHAMIPPLCAKGPVVSIRRFIEAQDGAEALVDNAMLSQPMLELLGLAVDAGLNILIAGGAAAGKTTLLNGISQFIPAGERVITIEESAELQLRHPHVVTLEARQGNSEGRGQVDLRMLLRNALRMRADRIIVGEVRGHEVFEMLQAMTVGHDGSLSTVHANSPSDALKRLESLALLADVGLPREAIREIIGSAVQLIVQVARFRDGSRCVTSIGEVLSDQGRLRVREVFRFQPAPLVAQGDAEPGAALNRRGCHLPGAQPPIFLASLGQRGYAVPASLMALYPATGEEVGHG
ncbi:CpaF family protein [Pseudomonas sp. LPB0260]|uniref:CpaF family protein n=1 Tax=Pseudomonas sp. LPB0260 TaxID=2614442 RepID=UPI0015C22FFC|nr:CpaF family protein [Pseudomonas sp. LPB0260]QLC74454.1 CpaF family protein [Pseudomonas sp. LPB0260]QLC77224.1 CpaF family protein [Pseudomonas sp. LPB0260]